jgi:hypothetical protein
MFGSEFKDKDDLEKLLSSHPHWEKLKQILTHGASFPLSPMNEIQRNTDLEFHKNRGNHKSALKNAEILDKIIKEDVERGFALPLPIHLTKYIPNASIAPLGCQEQETINERGERIPKYRMTHDQSFPGPSNLSVNLRVIQEQLPPCMYSHVLLRSIHYIVDLRSRHPNKRIFINKFDIDAAYRRCHISGPTASECLTIYKDTLLMALRMTFGGSPCPALWGYISDTLADICNTLIQCNDWDHNTLFDHISSSIKTPSPLPDETPFHQAKPLIVEIPKNDKGKVDIYIDDTIAITPDLSNNVSRMVSAVPLAIRSITCPLNHLDEIPRNDIISMKKFEAEGKMEEVKIVLGWQINTRSLTISLPPDKHNKWSKNIESMISNHKVSHKNLEVLLGRLNHVASIIPILRHFLGRLRHALLRSTKHNWTYLRLCEKSDLHLIQSYLDEAKKGISLNNLVFRKPSIIYRSDACEFGLGGYNITSGNAWRFELPLQCRLKTSINSLEFIACVITIWIDIQNNQIPQESCILSQSDSSSASGWLRKSNFSDSTDEIIQMTTARHLAHLILHSKSCLYSQWFAGDENLVSDSLSRDFHLTDFELTILITSSVPEQVPFGFQIHPLPTKIVSWVTSLLQNQPAGIPWSKQQIRSKLSLGQDTKITYIPLESKMTHTSTNFPDSNDTKSLGLSATQLEKVDYLINKTKLLNLKQLDPPSIMWHRPTSWLTDQIHDSTTITNLHSFYKDNYAVTKIQTNQKYNR